MITLCPMSPARNKPLLTQDPPRFYYGWIIVAVSSLTLVAAFGTRLSFTVFFVALIEEFQWSRASTSFIFSVNMIVFAFCSAPAGLALDRWGARRVFGVGAGLLTLGLFLSSKIDSLFQLAFTYGVVVGLGITILGLGLQAGLVSRWFRRRRGMAIGLTFAGTGVGTLVTTPLVEYLIKVTDWRNAYVILAGLAVVTVPIILIFMRSDPSKLGLKIDGGLDSGIDDPTELRTAGQKLWTMAEATRTPAFWLVIIASLGAIGPLRMLTVHQLAAVVSAGFDRLYAASVIGFSGAITAVSFISFGTISDKIGRRKAYAVGSLCLLGAMVILASISRPEQQSFLILYAILLGLGEGSRASLITAVASDLFPGNALGAINGAVGSAFGAGAAVMPWLAGWLFDRKGSYLTAFIIAGVLVAISTLALWLAPRYTEIKLEGDLS